jgi:hypothetical protein
MLKSPFLPLTHRLQGTDHQRVAKLDRENEVAPPAKVASSVGRVRGLRVFLSRKLILHIIRKHIFGVTLITTGNANSAYGIEALTEGGRSKDK